ncbi:hypothetical protein Pryu01_00683 [Paraliobacillus ryukyuensis]|uniref:Putative dehydrogenase n=1 Tax=Paraliobacillus ryukyuensis TaxID=200904 RepID=A0A366EEJ2_9BACI|nr:putative dehydrogenase [Paraliobacillus ryukyuensis]
MVKNFGIIGYSNENGHPYSFSSIINGYNKDELINSGWSVIYDYLKIRDISEFGLRNCKVSHVWTQDKLISEQIAKSCNINHVVDHFEEMLDKVDAVIIARDDYESHLSIATPFLEKGIKVFIDKPLTLRLDELKFFRPYLTNNLLFSTSSMRYARELDGLRADTNNLNEIITIQTSVLNDWNKYGIHMIDAILSFCKIPPYSVEFKKGKHDMYIVRFQNDLIWTINVLGKNASKTFSIQVLTEKWNKSVEIEDNFTMFRRMLWRFNELVQDNKMYFSSSEIVLSNIILMAGEKSRVENREVYINEYSEIL